MKPRVYIETFGCQMNVADSERAATGLRASGYDLCKSIDEADVVLLNTCSVREKAERKVYTRIGEVRAARPDKRDLAGRRDGLCGPTRRRSSFRTCFIRQHGDRNARHRSTSDTHRTCARRRTKSSRPRRARRNKIPGTSLQLSDTHLTSPSFPSSKAATSSARSASCLTHADVRRSRPASEIVAETKKLQALGYKEIHLIGQNVNSYRPRVEDGLEGFAGATPFCRLLRAVAATDLPRIKFTTSFPRDFHPDIVTAIEENPNLCDWVHLPVQSGSDRVLKLMRRGHKRSDYLERIQRIKNSSRRLALTSDIIVGFPGETDEDFHETLTLVQECEYDSLYIFKYSKRAGTPAAEFHDNVPETEKTARFLELEKVQRAAQDKIYRSYVGRKLSVLAERQSSRSESDLTGHSTCHKVVNFKGDNSLEGEIVDVVVTEAKTNSLYGSLV